MSITSNGVLYPRFRQSKHPKDENFIIKTMSLIVMILSLLLIIWISIDTFKKVDFLENHAYMTFQFWVCIFFIIDFFVELCYADNRWRYFRRRFFFLLISIPYLNIINQLDIHMSHDAIYFIRFIPLLRGALAMSIVIGYLSSNAITSLCMSYLSIIILITYFCSLIFYQRENGVNPMVTSYWDSLWWSAMNMTTVGCNISPMTVAGKIIAVILPICGMIMFPLFTVYLTNFVTGLVQRGHEDKNKEANSNS
ncbi:MAG: potassium channel family protein [Muribaculaceae bacterium]|nr:potassium channel family protein [Muribaculaceae bacterium]MDE6575366.1 potassium channel family protein [Muribaculaceae bacterium]